MTADGVLRALAHVERLPSDVCALRVDLRAVRVMEDRALRTLGAALLHWRAVRQGMSRVRLSAGYWLSSGGAWRPVHTP